MFWFWPSPPRRVGAVAHQLGQGGVSRNGRDLVGSATCLRQASRGSLTETMGRAVREPRLVALLTEPRTERLRLERAAILGCEKCQVSACCCDEHHLQLRVHWDGQLCAGLLLPNVQKAVADMLRAHANDITASLPGIEQQS